MLISLFNYYTFKLKTRPDRIVLRFVSPLSPTPTPTAHKSVCTRKRRKVQDRKIDRTYTNTLDLIPVTNRGIRLRRCVFQSNSFVEQSGLQSTDTKKSIIIDFSTSTRKLNDRRTYVITDELFVTFEWRL